MPCPYAARIRNSYGWHLPQSDRRHQSALRQQTFLTPTPCHHDSSAETIPAKPHLLTTRRSLLQVAVVRDCAAE